MPNAYFAVGLYIARALISQVSCHLLCYLLDVMLHTACDLLWSLPYHLYIKGMYGVDLHLCGAFVCVCVCVSVDSV